MREIKFRYTFKRNEDGHIYQIVVPLAVLEDGHGEIFTMLRNDLWTLVARDQWTGLHDKEGREIWEGDVCKHTWDGDVMSHPGEDVFVVEQDKGARYLCFDCLAGKQSYQLEVIGNVHENPELLDGK